MPCPGVPDDDPDLEDPPPEPPFTPKPGVDVSLEPPQPPPIEVIEEKTELLPLMPTTPLPSTLAPPAPTVTVYSVEVAIDNAVSDEPPPPDVSDE